MLINDHELLKKGIALAQSKDADVVQLSNVDQLNEFSEMFWEDDEGDTVRENIEDAAQYEIKYPFYIKITGNRNGNGFTNYKDIIENYEDIKRLLDRYEDYGKNDDVDMAIYNV